MCTHKSGRSSGLVFTPTFRLTLPGIFNAYRFFNGIFSGAHHKFVTLML